MSPLWGPLCPYMHSTVAFLLSHMWIRKSGRLLIGSSTRGSWGGKYIQPMMKSPSTWVNNLWKILKLLLGLLPALHEQDLVSVPQLYANILTEKQHLPQHWAIHHKVLCQAAISPRYVCMGEALQHTSTTSHHMINFCDASPIVYYELHCAWLKHKKTTQKEEMLKAADSTVCSLSVRMESVKGKKLTMFLSVQLKQHTAHQTIPPSISPLIWRQTVQRRNVHTGWCIHTEFHSHTHSHNPSCCSHPPWGLCTYGVCTRLYSPCARSLGGAS